MMNKLRGNRLALGLAVIGTAAWLAGCDQFGGGPSVSGNSDYRRAKNYFEAKDYRSAAEAYEQALQVNPEFAPAHLEAGLLYDDKLNDPISAIYHYRRYLALKPDSDKRQLVQDFIERAKLTLAAKLPQSPIVDPGELTRLQNEKTTLMQENTQLKSRVAELEKALAGRVSRPVAVAPVPPAPAPPRTPVAPAAAPIATPVAVARPATAPRGRTHTVQKGDTLYSLALQYYGTRAAWDKIYQANRAALSHKDQLKLGQELVIP